MTHQQKCKIYSTCIPSSGSELVEIETIILNGLYRFSILGIPQRNSSDIKDRVYSALRSQKLLNLKSDNKKITVSILPTDIEKKGSTYDLAIALSCLVHMGQIEIHEDIIAIGELSILGHIIPSKYILKSIYQAMHSNCKVIICAPEDLEILDNHQNDLYRLATNHEIKFIAAHTLSEAVECLKRGKYFECKNITTIKHTPRAFDQVNVTDINIFKIILALCTDRNIFIENKKNSYIKKFLKNLIYYSHRLTDIEVLKISNNLHLADAQIIEKYTYPIITSIDNQTQKDDLLFSLQESVFGFSVIEDFVSISEETFYLIKKYRKSTILSFYNACPCGNGNAFFTSTFDDKCLCLQRSIIRHRQKIRRLENNFFDFHITNVEDVSLAYDSTDYIHFNKIISVFKNSDREAWSKKVEAEVRERYASQFEKADLDDIVNLSKDIAKLNQMLCKTKSTESGDTVDLAIKLFKKGF